MGKSPYVPFLTPIPTAHTSMAESTSKPFMMQLREALVRSKRRLKKRLQLRWNESGSVFKTATMERAGNSDLDGWPLIRASLDALESSADWFGPMKAAIGPLIECVEVYERECDGRKEKLKLRKKLNAIMHDLTELKKHPAGFAMTGSIQCIIRDIQEEAETINDENKTAISTGRRLRSIMEGTGEILECYSRIDEHLQRLARNVNLRIMDTIYEQAKDSRLTQILSAESAFYDSGDVKRGGCAPGTREPQIKMLIEWASNPDSGRTCWMNEMAGTGKTTIAYTVCKMLGSQLGASFFCSRAISECRQVKSIIPCIAYQLARFSVPFSGALVKALMASPDVHLRSLKQQYEKLIFEPSVEVKESLPADVIIVIDALDECEDPDSVGQILDLLLSPDYKLPIRYFVSSRPEKEICARMEARTSESGDIPLVLYDLQSDIVAADIKRYMQLELKDVRLNDEQWSKVLKQCGVLFIYASTMCHFIKQGHATDTLDESLEAIINSSYIPVEGEQPIDSLYSTILTSAFKRSGMSKGNMERMKAVLGSVICAVEPMKRDTIVSLLRLNSLQHLDSLLQPLRSVLNISKESGLVTTLHASFPDYLLSRDRSGEFWCDAARRHTALAEACLQAIEASEPKMNICGLPSSHLLDSEVEGLNERVQRAISPGLAYACQHWPKHLGRGEYRAALVDRVRTFFFDNLLLWMEVANLLKKMRHGTGIIQQAERWCTKTTIPEDVSRIAHDAVHFVSVYANHPTSESTPHIYISMLPFWPASRPVSIAYMPRTAGLVKPQGTAISQRVLSLLATWKVSRGLVRSMSLSADGTRLAVPAKRSIDILDTFTGEVIVSLTSQLVQRVEHFATSPDGTQVAVRGINSTLQLWNVNKDDTTTELLPSTGSSIYSVAFSSNAYHIACGLGNGDIYICSLSTDKPPLGPLKGHNDRVSSVAFSPDCLHLASGSWDNTVRIWDVRTGHSIGQPFTGHTDSITSVSYSPDGSHIVSASNDFSIRVWDIRAAQTVLGPLKAHSGWVTSATFSPNAVFIASASVDKTIRVYDALTGSTVLGPLQAHTRWVNSVIFSPDRSRLFSCSDDGTVRIWNVQDAAVSNAQPSATGPSGAIASIRHSRSGLRVVSGSSDGAVRVWNAETGKLVLGPLSGHNSTVSCVDYSPSGRYIASASWDCTLRIWDADTGQDVHGAIRGHNHALRSVRFSPDESTIVSGLDGGAVRLWDVKTGQCVLQPLQGGSAVWSVGFSPDGQRVVSGFRDGTLRVIDRRTGETVVGPVHGHSDTVNSVEFSPNGIQIVSGSDDNSVRVWDAQTGLQVTVCGGDGVSHDSGVTSVGFSPNGLYIVSGSEDNTVCVWDAHTGKMLLGPLRRHTNVIRCVQFSPDSSHVVSCSSDGTIRFWDVSSCATKSRTREQMAGGESQAANPGQDHSKALDSWTLDRDGWAVDSENRRLVWVPSDLRIPLAIPPNDLVISPQGCWRLGFVGAMMGGAWAGCYRL
ncbi:peptidase C14 [Rhizoctonia solani]|uniref:Peptidase C14 n=1 Tax=Rhizoctonia solani TaxID=456999 RepID=A0A8H8P2U1_9AGAM|nr:peptidase C14 [Rhizoctonia solani]QRW22622.1 peptidase C14 [Rhizoctonia solani]